MDTAEAKRTNLDIERGITAECWFCEAVFVKITDCPTCGFYRCNSCLRCGCSIPDGLPAESVREMLRKTIRAVSRFRLKK